VRVHAETLPAEKRFREWAAVVMNLVASWKTRMDDADRQWERDHTGVRNPFSIDGVKAVQPVKPGGAANERLSEIWPAITALMERKRP
jgi:hypothetical protein